MAASFGNLKDRIAVVTGASSGIGQAIAREFAAADAALMITCRSSTPALEQEADRLRAMGAAVQTFTGDLSEAGSRTRLISETMDRFGRIDCWINNAGADLLTGEYARASYESKLQRLLDVDVAATVLLSQRVAALMADQGRGVILTIGWDQADRGMEGDSGELFAVAKNAVMGFTRSLALSCAPAVRVNCIAPGWIRTAWGDQASDVWQQRVLQETPLKRWGEPADIAKAARFLCSDDASFITGQVWNVNGGAVR